MTHLFVTPCGKGCIDLLSRHGAVVDSEHIAIGALMSDAFGSKVKEKMGDIFVDQVVQLPAATEATRCVIS